MLSPTKVLRNVEKKLGFKFNELELDAEEMMDNIRDETLPVFSKYFPFQEKIKLTREDGIEGERGLYYIKSEFEIINVNRIISNGGYNTAIDNGRLIPRISSNYEDPIGSQLMADIQSMVQNPITHRFIYPNKVEIMPSGTDVNSLTIILNCVHPEHFGTIPVNLQDQFLKLALLDTQEALYQIRHRFANLRTTYGDIELFIDDLQNASDKKEELIETFKSSVIKNPHRKKIFVI